MTKTQLQIHASCVAIGDKGVLLLGKSGAGKSETALKLLDYPDSCLVADDRVDLYTKDNKLFATAPPALSGLIEVRQVGIVNVPFLPLITVSLCVQLIGTDLEAHPCERLPLPQLQFFLDHPVRCLTLVSQQIATASKIRAALLYPTVTDLP